MMSWMLCRNHVSCLMQDMVFFSFLIYSLATLFFILDGSLFNAIDTILVIGLGMARDYIYHINCAGASPADCGS